MSLIKMLGSKNVLRGTIENIVKNESISNNEKVDSLYLLLEIAVESIEEATASDIYESIENPCLN